MKGFKSVLFIFETKHGNRYNVLTSKINTAYIYDANSPYNIEDIMRLLFKIDNNFNPKIDIETGRNVGYTNLK